VEVKGREGRKSKRCGRVERIRPRQTLKGRGEVGKRVKERER